ncbi:50S ribosomal L9 C-terminal domain-containing protein, partial [Staphylococcus epidermidis]|uniref:50S ribosomal L9 C-terminal domain-containing protein n=1 Tax=Staphylococcus epidermidis TaxID=1282 RepID=UPI0028CB9C9C
TPANLKQLQQQNKPPQPDTQQQIHDPKPLKQHLKHIQLQLSAKTPQPPKLFPSITTKQIPQPLKKQHHIKIHKRKIHLPHPIHALRYTNLPLKLH